MMQLMKQPAAAQDARADGEENTMPLLHVAADPRRARAMRSTQESPRRSRRGGALAFGVSLLAIVAGAAVGVAPASAAVGDYGLTPLCATGRQVGSWAQKRTGTFDTYVRAVTGCATAYLSPGSDGDSTWHRPRPGSRIASEWTTNGVKIRSVALSGKVEWFTPPDSGVSMVDPGYRMGVETGTAKVVRDTTGTLNTTLSGGGSDTLSVFVGCQPNSAAYCDSSWTDMWGDAYGAIGYDYWTPWGSAPILQPTPLDLRVVLADEFAPRATITNAPSGDWTGSVTVHVDAADRAPGSGVQRADFVVDDALRESAPLSAGTPFASTCTPTSEGLYSVTQPCSPEGVQPFTLDTAQLRDGEHTITFNVLDASGRAATIAGYPRTIVTTNKPVLTAAPSKGGGTTQVGQTLSIDNGTWARSPRAFSYQWQLGGEPLAGQTASTFSTTLDQAYKQLSVVVTASNTGGETSTTVNFGTLTDARGFASAEDARRFDDEQQRRGGSGGGDDEDPGTVGGGLDRRTPSGGGNDQEPPKKEIVYVDPTRVTNPIAQEPGRTGNGTNATVKARHTLAFSVKGRAATTVRGSKSARWTVSGRVTDQAGKGIAGAKVTFATQAPGEQWARGATVTSGTDGSYSWKLPAGPTRRVQAAYYAFSDSSAPVLSNAITARSTGTVTLKAVKKKVKAGKVFKLKGSVTPDFLPRTGVLVTIEGYQTGFGWQTVKVVRADRTGAFSAGVPLKFRGTYKFRALVKQWKLDPKTSKTVKAVSA